MTSVKKNSKKLAVKNKVNSTTKKKSRLSKFRIYYEAI